MGAGSPLTGAVITNGDNGCYKLGQPLLLQLGADWFITDRCSL